MSSARVNILRIQFERARVGVAILLERNGKARLFRPGTVIGEVEALPDQHVDVGDLRSPEPSRQCNSMFLTIETARLPCCTRPWKGCPLTA